MNSKNDTLEPQGIRSTVNPNGLYTEQKGNAIWNGEEFEYPVINSVKKGGICHSEGQSQLLNAVKEILR